MQVLNTPVATPLQLALAWAANGYRVFPLNPDSNAPYVEAWPTVATVDRSTITDWWNRWPHARPGALMGDAVAIDLDAKNGKVGLVTWQRLIREHGDPGNKDAQITRHNGVHFFYRNPGNLYLKSKAPIRADWPDVDSRANNGYVAAYGDPPAPVGQLDILPDWLVTEMVDNTKYDRPLLQNGVPSISMPPERALNIANKEIKVLAATKEGNRNHALNHAAYTVGAVAYAIPDHANALWCDLLKVAKGIGLDEREAKRTIRSGWCAGCAHPMGGERTDAATAFEKPAKLPAGAYPIPESYEERKRLQRELNQKIGENLEDYPFTPVMSLDEMLGDLAFVTSANAVASVSRFTVRKLDNARNEYKASVTEIPNNDGKPSKWKQTLDSWCSHPKRVTVDVVTWWPGQPFLCEAPTTSSHGVRAFNTYRPVRVLPPPSNWQEWVAPFLAHVEYLVPVEAERHGFLKWLAHIVQRPHELPHTYYLMVTEQTGIGRGTLASILTRVLRGAVAANVDLPGMLQSGYNGILSGKLLATVDEIREGNSSDRWRKAERIKSLVTEEIRHINPKYGVQSIEKNCCRWLLFSNHKDALPFDNNDRRAIVIANPTERKPPEWFGWLHDVLDRPEFMGAVQHYLATLDLTGFNPGQLAPMNEAKQLSLLAMESDHDRKAREFAAVWPGPLATTADLRDFMGGDTPAPRAMGHVIKRAGMVTCAKPIRMGTQTFDVLIIRGDYDRETIDAADNAWKRQQINAAQTTWRNL